MREPSGCVIHKYGRQRIAIMTAITYGGYYADTFLIFGTTQHRCFLQTVFNIPSHQSICSMRKLVCQEENEKIFKIIYMAIMK